MSIIKKLISTGIIAASLLVYSPASIKPSCVQKIEQYCQKFNLLICLNQEQRAKIAYLRDNEFIIKQEVYGEFEIARYGKKGTIAQHVTDDLINYDIEKFNSFRNSLMEKGYSESDVEKYLDILGTKGNIVISEEIFFTILSLEKVLMHERTHRIYHELSFEEKMDICSAYIDLTSRKVYIGNNEEPLVKESINAKGAITNDVRLNFNEFFPHLVSGVLDKRIEYVILKEYPNAYKIYLNIREASKPNSAEECQD
jgi:hypothetical protein